MVVFYPTPNVHFQAIGWDSIEQAILFEWRATSASQDRARKWQARANQSGHLRLFLVLTRMSPPQKHVCVLEARKAGERRWDKRSQHSYHFFFNYCYYYWNTKREPLRRRGEGHQKEKREMTGMRSLRSSALCWLASLTARRE